MRFGAIHTPRPAGIARLSSRVGAPSSPIPNWLARFPPDGDPLGNDDFGDCVDAADCQIIRIMGGKADRAMALARYTQTGFDLATGQPDNGSDTRADMLNWCAAPIVDLSGKAWPIYWASADHTDEADVENALRLFPLLITVGLPAPIANDPERWSEPPQPGWTADEAHRIVLGYRDDKGWWVRTWGSDYAVSPALLRLMLLAVDIPIPRPASAPSELQIDGLDYAALEADLAALAA